MSELVKVAVGVIENTRGEILIARRPQGKHLAGYWEFPGGKIEPPEDCQSALIRELVEEVAFDAGASFEIAPLITLCWDYGHKQVELQVQHLTGYSGSALGNEGQEICWLNRDKLASINFPPANKPILSALNLPKEVLITADEESDSIFMDKLDFALSCGVELVQVRSKNLDKTAYQKRVAKILQFYSTRKNGPRFLFNCPPEYFETSWPRNIHLSSQRLLSNEIECSLGNFDFVSASVHNEVEMARANALSLDCVFCSPVLTTRSHPEVKPIGWSGFSALCKQAQIPVYALGGLTREDLPLALTKGAQGIAAIRAFWKIN